MNPHIRHKELIQFADKYVNLTRDALTKYRAQVSNMRDDLGKKIREDPDFVLKKMLHAGSVRKGTALQSTFDMDVVVYLEKEDAPSSGQNMISWLRDRLLEVYPTKDYHDFILDQHAVEIDFKGTGLNVDVVPVLQDEADPDYGEMINRYGQRSRTSVPGQLQYFRESIERHDGARQFIRLVKRWRDCQKLAREDFKLRSFVIELLILNLINRQGLNTKDMRLGLEQVFEYLSGPHFGEAITSGHPTPSPRVDQPWLVLDPVAAENNVASQINAQHLELIRRRAQDAFDAIMDAASNPVKGEAREAWTEVLGGNFT